MRVGGGMVYRNQKVLQVKSVEVKEDDSSEEEQLEERRFTNFNQNVKISDPYEVPTIPVIPDELPEGAPPEGEKKKRRKKPRRKKKNGEKGGGEESQALNQTTDSGTTLNSESEPVDPEFEQQLILFK